MSNKLTYSVLIGLSQAADEVDDLVNWEPGSGAKAKLGTLVNDSVKLAKLHQALQRLARYNHLLKGTEVSQ